jgi:glycosyltransferase involved in cell wall biosynthesis
VTLDAHQRRSVAVARERAEAAPAEALAAPDPRLRACVVVPAKDEAERVGRCIAALGDQRGVDPAGYEVILVLDACSDHTGAHALVAAPPSLRLHVIETDGRGAGYARRAGMELASERLHALARPRGLVASTDADTVVRPDWLVAQLDLLAAGAHAIGGRIDLLPDEAALLPAAAIAARRRSLIVRHQRARATGDAEHGHFSGASLSLTAQAYAYVGGLEPRVALEDEALERALGRHGVPIVRSNAVRVETSARTDGRAPLGLAHDLALAVERAREADTLA